jgi:hypothetical protein
MIPRIAAFVYLIAAAAQAATPHLAYIDPAGLQRGVDNDITISGDRIDDARGLLFYASGIQVLSVQPGPGGHVHARLHVAADCPLGEHDFRVWTASGISELLPLYVTPYPNITSSDSNHTIAEAQPVPLNCSVNGIVHDEEIHYFSIQAKKGERITAEVEGMRLGRDFFDPWAAILDATGHQLAVNDDNSLLVQDPLVSIVAPTDGTYLVAIRESTWAGNEHSFFRLHIGSFPQPLAVYPPGGPAGQAIPVTYFGDVKGPIKSTVSLPTDTSVPFAATASDASLLAPTPLLMRVSPFPNVLSQEPDHDIAHATPMGQPAPVPPIAFNGIITDESEKDYFRFHATKGAVLDVTVYARQLRSPLDSYIQIFDPKGRHIATNDDAEGPDSYLRLNVPEDGDYCVSIKDHLGRGGPTFVYRIEVVPVTPSVSFTVPIVVKDTQERQTVVVPRGNRFAIMLRTKREGVDDDFRLVLPSLPPGVTLQSGSLAGDLIPVVFQAAPDAAVSATLSRVIAQPADPKKQVASDYTQTVEFDYAEPNQYPYFKTNIHGIAISVAEEAPFRLELVPPPFPVLQDGPASLTVTAVRKPGFTGPINVSMLYNPPGIGSESVVTIPEKQNSVDLPINASPDAKAKTWQVAVIGTADAGHGPVWTSSALVPLTIAKPFIVGHLGRASAVQGQPATITCQLDQNIHFDGKAHIRLLGLPTKATAPDLDVTAADKQAVFNIATDPTTPSGQHRDLFCEVTIEKNGVKLVAHTAGGGVLRIDKVTAPKKELAAK